MSSLFKAEDGGDMFLRNFGSLSTDYTALYFRIVCIKSGPQIPALAFIDLLSFIPEDSTLHNYSCENLETCK
jgi:hypothetical protein